VGKVEDKFGFAEDSFKPLVNCRPIICRPLNYLVECLVESSRTVDQSIYVAGFTS
jgi:hypothetical protein